MRRHAFRDTSVMFPPQQKSVTAVFQRYSLTTIALTVEPSALYEAENNTGQSGTSFSSGCGGYSGTGYMDYGAAGTYLEWNNVKENAGNKILVFRYVNGTTPNDCELYLNGAKSTALFFPPAGGWSDWKTVSCTLALQSGTTTVRLRQTSANGPNLDRMEIFAAASGTVGIQPDGRAIPAHKPRRRLAAAGTMLIVNGGDAASPVDVYTSSGRMVLRSVRGSAVPIGTLGNGLYIIGKRGGGKLKFLKN